jgi:hypothetical protein
MKTLLATPAKPRLVINFAKIVPLFEQAPQTSLTPLRDRLVNVQLIQGGPSPQTALEKRQSRSAPAARLAAMSPQTIVIPKGVGSMSRMAGTVDLENRGVANLDLPFGMPRFVNAATLKRMLKAKNSDLLLKRSGERWTICDDSTRVDLADDSVEFRLGAVQIFS